jgi:hypothetical protein
VDVNENYVTLFVPGCCKNYGEGPRENTPIC